MIRTAAFYWAIILVLLLVINIFPFIVSQNLVLKSKQDDMLDSAGLIAGTLSSLKSLEHENVSSVIELLGRKETFRILVANQSFETIYDNSSTADRTGSSLMLGGAMTAMSGMDVFKAVWQDEVLVSYAAVPVTYRENVIGVVFLYEYDMNQAALLKGTQVSVLRLSFFIFALIVALNIPIFRTFTSRFRKLIEGIGRVREGDYNFEMKIGGKDELTMFANEFNELSGRLQTIDEMRRQFVSDASHELKTPLSAIKLMADTILQNEDIGRENLVDFVGSISEEAERLSRITERLLTLTRLDARLNVLSETVDLKNQVEKAQRMLIPQAAEHNITVRTYFSGGCLVLGERDNVSQIVLNLMENAVKYNNPEGRVDVYVYPENESVILRVEDTGPGVPEEDMPRIFERFFRIDRARSRQTGGTGLGLAIVRRSVDLCGAEITCENRDSGGMRFVVTFRAAGADKEALGNQQQAMLKKVTFRAAGADKEGA